MCNVSLNYRENKITGIIESTFSVENNSFGALVVHELKPNGAAIPVTEENKREYVRLYVNYRFMRGIEQQFHWLQKGAAHFFFYYFICHFIQTYLIYFYFLIFFFLLNFRIW